MTGLGRWSGLTVVALGLVAVAERRAGADTIVYATSSGSTSTFGTLDLTTGQFGAISTLSVEVNALTADANGNLYAAASDGDLYTISGAGVASRFGTAVTPPGSGGTQYGFAGLAYAGTSGFYAPNLNRNTVYLDQVTSTGNGVSRVGPISVPNFDTPSGDLAYGPGGTLYLSAQSNNISGLYSVNTSTGAAMEIGTGLGNPGNDGLALVYAGGVLYGIDADEDSGSGNIGIYTINTTTGAATATGVDVTGLAQGFTLDTAGGLAPAVVPEPSSLVLMGLGGLAGVGYARRRRRVQVVASRPPDLDHP